MTFREFINLVKAEVGTALTEQRIIENTNWAQNEILGENCDLMRVKPDPFMTTEDGVYSYAASTLKKFRQA